MSHREDHTLADNGPLSGPSQINLGIDFGTRFTKVCYRDVGAEHSWFLQIERNGQPRSLLPSEVNISDNEALNVDFVGDRPSSDCVERYLKMRLARTDGDSHGTNHAFHRVQALSAFYIAEVIHYAMDAHHVEHRQQVVWSANVGVPVRYFYSSRVAVFRRVCAVAWCWALQDIIPSSVSDAMYQYAKTVEEVSIESSDCHAVSELSGAILSFVSDRGAQPGPYLYLDVGGGTVDGVSFRFDNREGTRTISCYYGEITNLGVDGLVRRFQIDEREWVRGMLVRERASTEAYQMLSEFKHPIQKLVAKVVVNGKRRDSQRWEQERRDRAPDARIMGPIREALPLTVFLGGGGARSGWYRNIICRTHGEFQHERLGIPKYQLTHLPIPSPSDLRMTDAQRDRFDRLAVAYGLSVPAGESPDFLGPNVFFGPLPTAYAEPPVDVISFDQNHTVFE